MDSTNAAADLAAMNAAHAADSHDLIRVQGARVNNLKDVSLEIPKRRLTVFTGVSGAGKSSLVFGTIAAESQRLINETDSAFVQGFMPTLDRPDVDVLKGLTTSILGDPHIGSAQAFSFNVPSASGVGAVTIERGGSATSERRSFSITGGMCPRCEGLGRVTDIDLAQLFILDMTAEVPCGRRAASKVAGTSRPGWADTSGREPGTDAANLCMAPGSRSCGRGVSCSRGSARLRLVAVASQRGTVEPGVTRRCTSQGHRRASRARGELGLVVRPGVAYGEARRMRMLVAEAPPRWRQAERVLEQSEMGSPDHETGRVTEPTSRRMVLASGTP